MAGNISWITVRLSVILGSTVSISIVKKNKIFKIFKEGQDPRLMPKHLEKSKPMSFTCILTRH